MPKEPGEKVLRLPSVLGVFSLRSSCCLPPHPGESFSPLPSSGKKGKEGEERRSPSSSNLTRTRPVATPTPQAEPAAGGLAERSPSRPGAPGAGAGSAEGAARGETPAHTPLPGAGSAKPQTRSAMPGLGISSPAEREGRRSKDAKCAPARAREE